MRRMKIAASLILMALGARALPSNERGPIGLSGHSVTAGEVIQRFIQASGGSELAKVGAEKRKGTLIRDVSGEILEACVGVYQSNTDPKVLYTVTTQGSHLMIERTGWGTRVEILPESETDYFMRFLNREFHFVKDAAGRVTGLETGPDRAVKAKKIK